MGFMLIVSACSTRLRWALVWLLVVLPGAGAGAAESPELAADTILARAQAAAGGDTWRTAHSLILRGEASFYQDGLFHARTTADSYRMWRVFPQTSREAHAANGQVRFVARDGDRTLFEISFDGEHSYDHNGLIDDTTATERWQSNFGFGIIRHALEPGFSLRRMADDTVDGHPCFLIEVTDPASRTTLFAIDRDSYAVRMVGFDTPQGFHHRLYDDFQRREGVSFTQPGHVRLYYDGVKTADIRWHDFELNTPIPRATFVLGAQQQHNPEATDGGDHDD